MLSRLPRRSIGSIVNILRTRHDELPPFKYQLAGFAERVQRRQGIDVHCNLCLWGKVLHSAVKVRDRYEEELNI